MLETKATYTIFIAAILMPNILKKRVSELKINSYLLLVGVIALIASFVAKISSNSNNSN
jgi:amino acid permease